MQADAIDPTRSRGSLALILVGVFVAATQLVPVIQFLVKVRRAHAQTTYACHDGQNAYESALSTYFNEKSRWRLGLRSGTRHGFGGPGVVYLAFDVGRFTVERSIPSCHDCQWAARKRRGRS